MKVLIVTCCFLWVRNVVSTLREEHRLGMFENRVLRRIFEPNREEVVGSLRMRGAIPLLPNTSSWRGA
jgi:hypothetical protein